MKKSAFFKINLIYFIAMIGIAVIFALGYLGVLVNEYVTTFLIQIVVMCAFPLLMYSIFISKSAKKTFQDFGFKKISFLSVVISFALGVILYFINNFVATASQSIITLFGYEEIVQTVSIELDYAYVLKEFLMTAILPGFCEEILHRGLMLNAGSKHSNPRICLFVSSLLFGLIHLNINQFFYASVLGFLMGYVSICSGSIFPSMIIHFMNNAISIYTYYGSYLDWPLATLYYDIQNFLIENVLLYALVISAFIALMVILYIYLTKKLSIERSKREVREIVNRLKDMDISSEESAELIEKSNSIIEQYKKRQFGFYIFGGRKTYFSEKVFLYSSLFLGTLLTIASFIYGMI